MSDTGIRKWLWDLRCRLRIRERVTMACWKRASLLSRKSTLEKYVRANPCVRLQIGCGKNPLPGWLNTDLQANSEVVYMDATKPLPFPDNTLDYVFSEHIFEHISYQAGSGFLWESFRALKPGGRIRISTPDLLFLINLYRDPKAGVIPAYMKFVIDTYIDDPKVATRGVVVNNFFYNWGHRFIYDFEMLDYTLRQAGFTDVVQCKPGESSDPNLRGLESHGKIIGEDFNLLESIVVEAVKPS